MDKKIIAAAVVVVLVVAAVGAFLVINKGSSDDDDSLTTVSAIARVNTDGSGLYLKSQYNPEDFYKVVDGKYVFNKEAWGGLVFGTPGSSSIQHVQLKDIATSMGLKFTKYTDGMQKNKDTLYFSDTIANADAAITKNAKVLDGGILWEPQYTKIISSDIYQGLLLTNDVFPGHTCCIIAGSTSFMKANPETTIAFLAAYSEAVQFIVDAQADTSSENYQKLIEICKKYTSGIEVQEIKDALANVIYKFSDDNKTGSLSKLKADIAALEADLEASGSITKKITDLGFKDSKEFADAIVDDSYLTSAVKANVPPLNEKKTVTVAAINGDIHQIGLRVAQDLGLFEKYNLDVVYSGLTNGGGVAQDLLNGHSDFGFLGAPPFTSNNVNGEYIHA